MAVILFNRNTVTQTISFKFSDIEFSAEKAKARDLVLKKDLGEISGSYSADVPTHSVKVLKLTKMSQG